MAPDGPTDPAAGSQGIGAVPLPPGYELVERLGSGGFATVWLAEQGRLGRRVAVKVLGETLEDSERERRFLAECKAIGRLSGHPGVVTVHDAGVTEAGHPYLVMEHLPGGSLHDRLKASGPLPWSQAVDVGVVVADALAAAHEAGILHRDVKPANLLVDDEGHVRLADFGIARLSEGTNTATGTLVGTLTFTPPEVLSGYRPGPTADVWALGATLHTLVSGEGPFASEHEEPPAATIARVLRSEPSELSPEVPTDLRDLLVRCLAREPADRPQTADATAALLQEVQQSHGLPVTGARSVGAGPVRPTPPGPTAPDGAGPTPPDVTVAASPAPPPPRATSRPPSAPGPVDPDAIAVAAGQTVVEEGGSGPTVAVPVDVGAAGPPPVAPAAPRSRGPWIVAAAVVLALVIVGLLVVATRSGDDGGSTATPASTTADTTVPVVAGPTVEGIWGVPAAVATGLEADPAQVNQFEREVDCTSASTCSAVAVEEDVVLAYPSDDGATTVVERVSAVDGTQVWGIEADTPPLNVAVALSGPVLLLATTESPGGGDVRAYRAFDPATGEARWERTYSNEDRSIRPAAQPSDSVMLLMLTEAFDGRSGVAAIDYGTGEELWKEPGRTLSSDAGAVYSFVDGTVVARDLQSGATRWTYAGGDLPIDEDGRSPAGRLGVVADDVLVTVSGGEVLGISTRDGTEVWDARAPLSAEGRDLGPPLVVSSAGGRAVVAATTGDMGVDPQSGRVAWREVRAPLVAGGDSNAWFGRDGSLTAGPLSASLRVLDLEDGSLTGVEVAPAGGISVSAEVDGVAVLADDGISGYDVDLDPVWTNPDPAGEGAALVAVDGGVIVLGSGGISLFRAP